MMITMDRRIFLTHVMGTVGGAAGLSLLGALDAASAQAARKTFCGFDKKRKANVCTVRLLSPVQYAPAKSADPFQCWLACVQMSLKFQGLIVPAQNIQRDVYEGKSAKTPWQDLSANGKSVSDIKGKSVQLVLEKLQVRAAEAAELLSENQPLIIGAFGHPVLLTSMTYTGDLLGGMTLVDATVLDPAPRQGTRVVSSPEWINVTFVTRVGVRKGAAKS